MRQRVLSFDPEDQADRDWFAILYNGFLTSGRLPRPNKGMDDNRREAAILRKLKAISRDATEDDRKIDADVSDGLRWLRTSSRRVLADGVGRLEVRLSEQEFEFFRKYIDGAGWTADLAIEAVDASDRLAGVPQTTEADDAE